MSDASWSSGTTMIAVLFVLAVWLVGGLLASVGSTLGGLILLLALWITFGLLYSGWGYPGTLRR